MAQTVKNLSVMQETQIRSLGQEDPLEKGMGETMETVTDFIFLGSKITVDGHCGHEIINTRSLEEKL